MANPRQNLQELELCLKDKSAIISLEQRLSWGLVICGMWFKLSFRGRGLSYEQGLLCWLSSFRRSPRSGAQGSRLILGTRPRLEWQENTRGKPAHSGRTGAPWVWMPDHEGGLGVSARKIATAASEKPEAVQHSVNIK